MRRLLVLGVLISLVGSANAANPTKSWKKILRKCYESDLIGKHPWFLGPSNLVGPGSVWRRSDDGTLGLKFELADAFKDAADRAALVRVNHPVFCSSDSSSKWNIRAGLPLPLTTTPLKAEVAATLRKAKRVTVSVEGYSVDLLKETPWEIAFLKLDKNNGYRAELFKQGALVQSNSLKVTGLRVVFTYEAALHTKAQSQFGGTTFVLGSVNDAEPEDDARLELSTHSESSESNGDPCATMADSETLSPGDANDGQVPGQVKFHFGLLNERQIVLCVKGPSYVLAAYSRIENGRIVGLGPHQRDHVTLVPVKIPKDTRYSP